MFKKILTSIGIGESVVDTKLKSSFFKPDEPVSGIVSIKTDGEMNIDKIELKLMERSLNHDETSDFETIDHEISNIVLTPAQDPDIPFIFDHEPVETREDRRYALLTHVYIGSSVDAYDEDEIIFSK